MATKWIPSSSHASTHPEPDGFSPCSCVCDSRLPLPADVPPAATSPPATSSGAPALGPFLPAPDGPFGPTIASPAHAHPLPSASVPPSPSPFASVPQTPPVSSHDPPQVSGLSVRACPVRSQFLPLSLSLAHPDSLASLRMFSRQ